MCVHVHKRLRSVLYKFRLELLLPAPLMLYCAPMAPAESETSDTWMLDPVDLKLIASGSAERWPNPAMSASLSLSPGKTLAGSWQCCVHTNSIPALPRRVLIKLVSTADTGYYYVTKKNPRTQTDKLTMRKYDPVVRKHVEFKEGKIK